MQLFVRQRNGKRLPVLRYLARMKYQKTQETPAHLPFAADSLPSTLLREGAPLAVPLPPRRVSKDRARIDAEWEAYFAKHPQEPRVMRGPDPWTFVVPKDGPVPSGPAPASETPAPPAPKQQTPKFPWRRDPEVTRRLREAVLSDPAEAKMDLRCLKQDEEDENGRKIRHDGWTLVKQRCFVETLAETGVVALACDAVRMSRQSAYFLRRHDSGRAFAALWDEARTIAGRGLVDDLISIAVDGETTELSEDGLTIAATRRKSPLRLVSIIEKIRSETILGKPRTMAASRNFHACVDMLEKGHIYADSQHKPISFPALLPPVPKDLDNPQPAVAYRRWTPERQRIFCEALAQGRTVNQACGHAGRQRSGAYNLRNRAEGQAFALAWDAALLVYSSEMIDTALAAAREGAHEEVARKARETRWRSNICPNVGLQVIARLDALKAREDKLYGDGYDRIGCGKDFGAALDLLESGEALKAIAAKGP
jgi:hypothetical protein